MVRKGFFHKIVSSKVVVVTFLIVLLFGIFATRYYFQFVVAKVKQLPVKQAPVTQIITSTPPIPTLASDRALKVAAYIYTHASQAQIKTWVEADPITMQVPGTMKVYSLSQKKIVDVPSRVPAIVLDNGITTSPKTPEQIVTVIAVELDQNPAHLALLEAEIEKSGLSQQSVSNQPQSSYDAAVSSFSKHIDDLIQQQNMREYIDIKFDQLNQ